MKDVNQYTNELARELFGEELSKHSWQTSGFYDFKELNSTAAVSMMRGLFAEELSLKGKDSTLWTFLEDSLPQFFYVIDQKSQRLYRVSKMMLLYSIEEGTELSFLTRDLAEIEQLGAKHGNRKPYFFIDKPTELEYQFITALGFQDFEELLKTMFKLLDTELNIHAPLPSLPQNPNTLAEKIARQEAIKRWHADATSALRSEQARLNLDDIQLFRKYLSTDVYQVRYRRRDYRFKPRSTDVLLKKLQANKFIVFDTDSWMSILENNFPGDLVPETEPIKTKIITFTYATLQQGLGIDTDIVQINYSFRIPLTVSGVLLLAHDDVLQMKFERIQDEIYETVRSLLDHHASVLAESFSKVLRTERSMPLEEALTQRIFQELSRILPDEFLYTCDKKDFATVTISRNKYS